MTIVRTLGGARVGVEGVGAGISAGQVAEASAVTAMRLPRMLKLNSATERASQKWSIVSLTGNLVQMRWRYFQMPLS